MAALRAFRFGFCSIGGDAGGAKRIMSAADAGIRPVMAAITTARASLVVGFAKAGA